MFDWLLDINDAVDKFAVRPPIFDNLLISTNALVENDWELHPGRVASHRACIFSDQRLNSGELTRFQARYDN